MDIFALVTLDTMKVGYLLAGDTPDTMNFRVDSLRGNYYDEKGIKDFETVMELKEAGKTQTEISGEIGVHVSTVNKMVQNGYKPFKTTARYFSDIVRGRGWFLENL